MARAVAPANDFGRGRKCAAGNFHPDSQLQVGFARGFQTGGGNQIYFVSSITF
jgi:hypothetical protein